MNALRKDILAALKQSAMNVATLTQLLQRNDWDVRRDDVLSALDDLQREVLIRNVCGLYEAY